jgi:hypothetical protein
MLQALHCADQHRQPGAVDVGDIREIHHEALGFLVDDFAQGGAQLG